MKYSASLISRKKNYDLTIMLLCSTAACTNTVCASRVKTKHKKRSQSKIVYSLECEE